MYISGVRAPVPMFQDTGFSSKRKTEIAKIEETISKMKKAEKSDKQLQVDRICEQMAKIRISNKISSIDIKLKGGCELTAAELNFLKKYKPELYQKAKEIEKERQLERIALKNCRTKDDVKMMLMLKINGFADAQREIRNDPDIFDDKKKEMLDQILRRDAAIKNEYLKFTSTKKYRDLPTRADILSGKAKEKIEEEFYGSGEIDSLYISLKKADKNVLLSAYNNKKEKDLDKKA